MSTILRLLCIPSLAFAALATFSAAVYAASSRGWFQPTVHVVVENASGQPMRALHIEHGGRGVKGRLELEPPQPGTSIAVSFFHQGEGGCQVFAFLADGKALTAHCGYAEPGYRFSFRITPAGIAGGLGQLRRL